MLTAKASAPGKAILFGEHAVVHGATAIAAAVSDLRIEVTTTLLAGPADAGFIVYFEDLQLENGEPAVGRISFARLRELIPEPVDKFDIATAINPDEAQQLRIQTEFASLPSQVSAGMTATSYLVRCLLLDAITTSSSTSSNSIQITIKSVGLPIGAGLGSSAAFSVATTAACFLLLHKLHFNHALFTDFDCNTTTIPPVLLPIINAWSYSGEVLMHGKPSGLDNSTSCYGGMVTYHKDPSTTAISFTNITNAPKLYVLLINTKVPRSTKQLVSMVGSLHNQLPTITQPVFNAISAVTDTFLASITAPGDVRYSYEETARLFDINHGLLCALGVGHSQLTRVVETCRSHGLSCKLTGAGGGGCAICLLPAETAEGDYKGLVQQLEEEMGFEVKITVLGGEGVTWILQE